MTLHDDEYCSVERVALILVMIALRPLFIVIGIAMLLPTASGLPVALECLVRLVDWLGSVL